MAVLCAVLAVSRSGVYAYAGAGESDSCRDGAELWESTDGQATPSGGLCRGA